MTPAYDIVVIGSGMSGLIAAAKSAAEGKRTVLVTKGQGTLPLTSGCIDLWGYTQEDPFVLAKNPYAEILKHIKNNPNHPYTYVLEVLEESLQFLQDVLIPSGYSLCGNLYENFEVITALGTIRPSAIVPSSMVLKDRHDIKYVIVVGFDGYIDFYPHMFLDNLGPRFFPQAIISTHIINFNKHFHKTNTNSLKANFLSHLLTQEKFQKDVIENLKFSLKHLMGQGDNSCINPREKVLIFPAVLGETALENSKIHRILRTELQAQIIEVPGLPPSLPGHRLDHGIYRYLKQRAVECRYNLEVIHYISDKNRVEKIIAVDSSKTRCEIEGKAFILATGSFWGGGLIAHQGKIVEPIFKLPITGTSSSKLTHSQFLTAKGQPFLNAGIDVDTFLRPNSVLENLYAAGSILAHSNYSAEKSGLGLALATGYKAGKLATHLL